MVRNKRNVQKYLCMLLCGMTVMMSGSVADLAEAAERMPQGDSSLDWHRQKLEEANCICGIIYLGFVDGSGDGDSYDRSSMEQVIQDSGYLEEFPFLSEIPDERIVETEYGCELYGIFPCDPDASVAVNEYVYDGPEDSTGRSGELLYRSEYGDPILLRCNVSDIIRDSELTIADSRGRVLVWQPGLSLYDGSVAVPSEEPCVYDVTFGYQDDWCMEGNGGLSTMQVVNCQEWVSLREDPDVNSARLDIVPLGTVLQNCWKVSEDFYYVEFNGLGGYVLGDYLRELPSGQ